MKKIIALFTLLFLGSLLLYGQRQAGISGKVLYQSFFPDKQNRNGSSFVPFYFNQTESIVLSDKITNGNVQKKEGGLHLTLPYGDAIGGMIYRNAAKRLFIRRRPKNAISEAFVLKENWIDIDWKIKNQTKKIGNYTATKAKGSFRGRDYTVWFTYEIPVPFGPWKLHGLPGLILEAEDSEKMMRFYARQVVIPFDTKDLIRVPTAENEITHQEEVYMQDNFDELLVKKLNARAPKGSKFTPNPNKDGRKYRTEKVYEWEETDGRNEKNE